MKHPLHRLALTGLALCGLLGAAQAAEPDWRDQVIYFALTDRFFDGDPANSDQKAGEYDPADNAKYSGGDLAGLTAKIDYIKGLGATTLMISPPVANQWWDPLAKYAGYHGYWASDFSSVDKHQGSLADYRKLSAALHAKGMLLVQDIVATHTGNFFQIEGGVWKPNLGSVPVQAPTQLPFKQNDMTKPQDAEAAIYHWTPIISNFGSKTEVQMNQQADLDDLNTENPVVVEALRKSYRYWIQEAGVDGFRVDSARYAPHGFWNEFLWGGDAKTPGIVPFAQSKGKKDFLVIGVSQENTSPFQDKADKTVSAFLGTESTPEFNAMMGYNLQADIKDVFALGRGTDQLSYRFKSIAKYFPDPSRLVNFLDNANMERFAAAAKPAAFRQALAMLFTIPGIPAIYYGTEQDLVESRASLFAKGYGSGGKDRFDTNAESYRYIASLAALRQSEKAFSRGKLVVLKDSAQAGVFAYSLSHAGRTVLVAFNSANATMVMDNTPTGLPAGTTLTRIFGNNDVLSGEAARLAGTPRNDSLRVGAEGQIQALLAPASVTVWVAAANAAKLPAAAAATLPSFAVTSPLSGSAAPGLKNTRLVISGKLDSASAITVGADGSWTAQIPAESLGNGSYSALVLGEQADGSLYLGPASRFKVELAYKVAATHDDPAGDDHGPKGVYQYPLNASYNRQNDIAKVELATAGNNLQIRITSATEVSNSWNPPNGFDHTTYYIYLALPGSKAGATAMPFQNASVPAGFAWNRMLFVGGWNSQISTDAGAGPKSYGTIIAPAPKIEVFKDKKQVVITVGGTTLDMVQSLSGTKVYVSCWDYDGTTNANRVMSAEGGDYLFGKGGPTDPYIMDDTPVLTIP